MFEGVAAREMANGVSLGVESFKELSKDVENGDPDEVGSARVAWRKEEQEKWERENGGELDGRVKAEVALTVEFAEIPLDGAYGAENEQRCESYQTCADADAFCDECGDDAHEGDGHGETIPEQGRVAWMPVVVGGAECSEEETEENEEVGPTLAKIEKCRDGGFGEEKNEAHCSRDGERKIGSNIAEVGNAEPGALVGKIVIGERLRDARDENKGDKKKNDYGKEDSEAGAPRNHFRLLRRRNIRRRGRWSGDGRRNRCLWSGHRRKKFGWRSSLPGWRRWRGLLV